jgi:putative salt-induced outer membrane protein YdiY
VQWKGTAVAGAAFDRGNTTRSSGTAALDAVRRAEADRITFGAGYAAEQTKDDDTGETNTTKRQMFMGLQYDLFFQPKWYMYANARGEKDGVADLALRLITGVGLGYQVVETDDLKFNIEAGPTWVSENYSDDTENIDYIAARVAWNLDWVFYPGVSFFHRARTSLRAVRPVGRDQDGLSLQALRQLLRRVQGALDLGLDAGRRQETPGSLCHPRDRLRLLAC